MRQGGGESRFQWQLNAQIRVLNFTFIDSPPFVSFFNASIHSISLFVPLVLTNQTVQLYSQVPFEH